MNEFTKEELEETLFALQEWNHPSCDYPRYIALRNKIQSRIDNYCEHQYSPTEALNIPLHCLKCGMKFE